MKLISDASNWKSWWSMRFIIASAFFSAVTVAYIGLPDDWLPAIPQVVKFTLALGALSTAGAAGVARVVQQQRLPQATAKGLPE